VEKKTTELSEVKLKALLKRLYVEMKMSCLDISRELMCSEEKVRTLLNKFQIKRRKVRKERKYVNTCQRRMV